MPTYQYACTNEDCGNRFELVQSFTDPAVTVCPVCEGPVRKVFSAVGVVFKGSGFYRTDSRATASKSKGATEKPAASSDSTSTSTASSGSSTSTSTSAPKAAAASA